MKEFHRFLSLSGYNRFTLCISITLRYAEVMLSTGSICWTETLRALWEQPPTHTRAHTKGHHSARQGESEHCWNAEGGKWVLEEDLHQHVRERWKNTEQ